MMRFEDSPCAKCPRQTAMAEALRHANIDLSMLLTEIYNRDMLKSVRETLDMIDALSLSRPHCAPPAKKDQP